MVLAAYETLYDIRRDWWTIIAAVLLLIVPVGIAVGAVRLAWARWRPLYPGAAIVAATVFPAAASIFVCLGVHGLSERSRSIGLLDRGEARVVEGVVTEFVPIPRHGHDSEHWKVAGVDFAPHSGESGRVREGMRVRVHYEESGSPALRPGSGRTILLIEAEAAP